VKLYLHIGTEKTGTTSVQKFLRFNRDLLKRQGILYPLAPGSENHIALAALAKEAGGELWDILGIGGGSDCQRFRDTIREKLRLELSEQSYHTVIMSGEHCSSRLRTDEEVRRLHDFLCPFFENVCIVVYLRRQDDFLLSTYSTDIKNGSSRPLSPPDKETIKFRYDYWELISRWSRVFSREQLICRRYGEKSLVGRDIIDDFMVALGLQQNPNFARPRNQNESLDAECLEFLRLLNQHLPLGKRRGNLVATLQAISCGPLMDLSPEIRENLMTAVRASNRLVAAEYFHNGIAEAGDPLFGPRGDGRARAHGHPLSMEKAVKIAATLLMNAKSEEAHENVVGRPRAA